MGRDLLLPLRDIAFARAPRPEDPRLALGFGLSGACCLVVPLLVGLLTGHPAGGATVGLGAWLVAARAIVNPAGVRTPYLFGVVVSVGVGTSLGVLVSGSSWMMIGAASALAGLGGLVRPIGVTPALTLLLTAANPLPLDPLPHTGLQLLGGLLPAVLLTLPWPWRRTRPAITTLNEVAAALAALAEAVPGADKGSMPGPTAGAAGRDAGTDGRQDAHPAASPAAERNESRNEGRSEGRDEWDARRRAAADALAAVGTARARRLRGERSRAADDVALALRRVFHEIVALRGLCDTLRRRAPRAVEEAGIGDLTASLADALRAYLADCPPLREPVVDFGARVDRLRERTTGGEREKVVLVLLRQVAHSVGRIQAALDGSAAQARRLCAPRLDIGGLDAAALGFGGLAAPPPLAFDDPRVRHALRVVLGTAFASVVIVLFKPAFPHWLVIAVLVTIQPTYGETRARVWARVGGSTVGGLVSAAVLNLTPGHWALVALIGVSAALAFGLAPTHQAYWATFMTMCVLLLLDFQVPQTARIAESRVVLTLAGGAIAIACTRLLWPRGETRRLADRVGRMLGSHAAAARALAQLARGRMAAERAEDRIRRAGVDAEMVTGALGYIAREPGGTAPEAVGGALDAAQRVRDDLLTMVSLLRDEPIGAGPVADVLDAVAGQLQAASQAVQAGEPYEPGEGVSRGLADDAMWVGAQAERRLAELESAPEAAGSRRALLRTAAADQALRSLDADAVRLCAAAGGAFAAVR
ncbi:FUSC family protein [Microbispora cellulosiformans]|uniref:FUSC family protein n=1 Tax=Microbispora cellulosiformans TaxID=2614688 RepID=A0A5J5K072_9ACTN|nr:FUSC family protein [Microbispora cellulosiformans]KAA9376293.1 FUSC family protein [Microbispora cellulosiformans]